MEAEHSWTLWLVAPTLLGLVAAVGFAIGRRRASRDARRSHNRHEILRALTVAQELEAIANRLRKALNKHLPAVARFNSRLAQFDHRGDLSWHELCDQADLLLKPALSLSTEISHAYAELLQQMTHLSAFADLRSDPLTGAANRRAFDESLNTSLAEQARHGTPLSLALLDIDCFKQINDLQGHLQGDRVMQDLVELLKRQARECDLLARYGGDEFALLMPHTDLAAASVVAERLRSCVEQRLSITISLGLAASVAADTPGSFLGRADAALYLAKDAGRNRVYLHDDDSQRIVALSEPAASGAESAEPGPDAASEVRPDTAATHDELEWVPHLSAEAY